MSMITPQQFRYCLKFCRIPVRFFFATEGERAFEILEREFIDVILLDIFMPGMNGYEVCAKLQANDRTRKIPVICTTAMTELDGLEKGLESGAIDYIMKPYIPTIVRARVTAYIELSRLRQRQ